MGEVVFRQEQCIEELKKDDYIKRKLEELKVIDEKQSSIDDLLKC